MFCHLVQFLANTNTNSFHEKMKRNNPLLEYLYTYRHNVHNIFSPWLSKIRKNINQTNDAYLSNNQGLYRNLLQHNMRQRNSYNSWASVCVLHWQVCYGLLRFWQIVIILIVVFLGKAHYVSCLLGQNRAH